MIDSKDAFPNDPTETVDTDGDGIGDNADAAADAAADTVVVAPAAVTAALTKAVDSLSGGAGNDSFSGQAGDANATIIAGDSISGGEGTDTLTLATNGTATTVAGLTLDSVESVRVSDSASTSSTINLFGSTGITDLESYASTGAALSFTNVGAIADLNLTNSSGTGTVSVGYTTAASKGTADVQNIVLSGATATGLVTIAGVETVNVVSATTGSTLAFAAANATSLTIDADAATTVDASSATNASIATIDMTASTAAVTLSAPGNTTMSITGGSGADVMTINNISSTMTVDGKDGSDTVKTSQTALTQFDVANINAEVLSFTAAPTSLALTGNANITTIDMAAGSGTAAITGVASGSTMNVKAASTSLGVTLSSAAGTADSLNINVGKAGATGTLGIAAGTLTATGVEAIHIDSVGKAIVTGDTGVNTMTIAGTSVTTVDVDGDRDLTLTHTGSTITTYDASESTGTQNTSNINFATTGATVTGGTDKDTLTGAAGADTITGNAGNDTITGGAGKDTISGGAGADGITGGTGADTMTGGAGADVFTIADGDSLAGANMDVVKDFTSGTDRLAMGQTNAKFIGNFSTLDEGLAGMTAVNQSFFVTSNSQLYIVATAGTLAASDDIVKLEGVTSLAATDLGTGALGLGSTISLTAASSVVNASTKTNATAFSTNLDDTISAGTEAILTGGSVDGLLGLDTLTMGGALTGTFDVGAVTANIEVLNLGTTGTTANSVTNVEQGTVTTSNNGDTVVLAASATAVNLTGGTGADSFTIAGASAAGTVNTGTGVVNDTLTVSGDTAATAAVVLTMGGGTADELVLSGANAHDVTGWTLSGVETLDYNNTNSVTISATQANALTNIDSGTTDDDVLIISGTMTTLDLSGNLDNMADNNGDVDDITATGITTFKVKGTEFATAGGAIIDLAATATLELTDAYAGVFTETVADGKIELDTISTLKFGDVVTKLEDGALTEFTTITGGGGAAAQITTSGATAFNFSTETITGVSIFDVASTAGNVNVTFSAANLATATTLTGDAATNLIINSDLTNTGLVLTDDDFDLLTVTTGVDIVVGQEFFDDGGIASVVGVNGGANETVTINMTGANTNATMTLVDTLTDIASFTVNDTSGNNAITTSDTDAVRKLTTIDLANGGSDNILLDNTNAADGTESNAVVIKNFTTGIGSGSDTIDATIAGTSASLGTVYNTYAAATNGDIDDELVEINSAVATANTISTADGGSFEAAIAAAVGTAANYSGGDALVAHFIIYGSAAQSGKAFIVKADSTTNLSATNLATGHITVEHIATLEGITADSFVNGNFIA
jgi:hypothetical protein